jgi:hypothetical protein
MDTINNQSLLEKQVATDMSSIPFGCFGDHGNITTSRGWGKCLSFEF